MVAIVSDSQPIDSVAFGVLLGESDKREERDTTTVDETDTATLDCVGWMRVYSESVVSFGVVCGDGVGLV